jgi:RimJ/RimL family protein N-acetyltransferase
MVHLRQGQELGVEDQDNYYKNVVANLFEEDQPKQILFAFLEKGELVAYGGLVHINWIDRHAEVSFLMNTELQEARFADYWGNYLKLLRFVVFDVLKFRKIFTHTFDVRPHLYPVLQAAGFTEEARLKNHCCINGEFKDVLIHAKFSSAPITFREANKDDVKLYFEWTNDPLVRSQSFQSNDIQYEDHVRWFESKIEDAKALMLLFSDEEAYIGQVRIEQKLDVNVISVSLAASSRGKRYGSRILRLVAIEFQKRAGGAISAYIRKDNQASIRSFESAGFVLESSLEINNIPSSKYIYR